ncbi:MAG: peptide ABC transporter substrate-binding protein [Dehalococcoidia bacterium]|nr:peptide ABC transporter substrate-binding protein [Dehalococcoidia bacterium]
MKKLFPVLLSALILLTGCAWPAATPSGGVGNLNLYGTDPYTLDPALAGDSASVGYIIQLFSGLLRLGDDLEPVADIAANWTISPDGRVYTFNLRQDVYFHSGRQVKAADFKYSWERAAAPETGSQTAATYLDDILGVDEVLAGRTKDISGVRVLDDFTLQVELVAPKSYFLAKLSYVTSFVVDRENVAQGPIWWRTPSGTGPFRLRSWVQGQEIVLVRFPDYYGEKAQLATVIYHLLSGYAMSLYEKGEIDIAEIGVDYYDLVTDPAGPFAQELVITSQLLLDYIIFDTTQPPFDDANVRRAFALAVDKTKIAALLFRNTVTPVEGVLPPGTPGFNEYLLGLAFDVERAQACLEASSYGANLPEITLTVSGYGGQIPSALEAIIYDWELYLGVRVTVRQLEPEEYLYNINAEKDNLVIFGWSADYAHPQNFLEVLFGAGRPYNIGEYEGAAFNELLRQAGASQDEAESLRLYQAAEQALIDDAACIPLWSGESYTLIRPYVRGYIPNPLGLVWLNTVWLER